MNVPRVPWIEPHCETYRPNCTCDYIGRGCTYCSIGSTGYMKREGRPPVQAWTLSPGIPKWLKKRIATERAEVEEDYESMVHEPLLGTSSSWDIEGDPLQNLRDVLAEDKR